MFCETFIQNKHPYLKRVAYNVKEVLLKLVHWRCLKKWLVTLISWCIPTKAYRSLAFEIALCSFFTSRVWSSKSTSKLLLEFIFPNRVTTPVNVVCTRCCPAHFLKCFAWRKRNWTSASKEKQQQQKNNRTSSGFVFTYTTNKTQRSNPKQHIIPLIIFMNLCTYEPQNTHVKNKHEHLLFVYTFQCAPVDSRRQPLQNFVSHQNHQKIPRVSTFAFLKRSRLRVTAFQTVDPVTYNNFVLSIQELVISAHVVHVHKVTKQASPTS